MYPLGRPLIWQRFFSLTRDELRGSSSNALQSPAAFKAARLSAYCFTIPCLFFSLATTDVFAIFCFCGPPLRQPVLLPFDVTERHSQLFQQLVCFFVGL